MYGWPSITTEWNYFVGVNNSSYHTLTLAHESQSDLCKHSHQNWSLETWSKSKGEMMCFSRLIYTQCVLFIQMCEICLLFGHRMTTPFSCIHPWFLCYVSHYSSEYILCLIDAVELQPVVSCLGIGTCAEQIPLEWIPAVQTLLSKSL